MSSFAQRLVSISLSAVFTLAILGSVELLAQPQAQAQQWAQAAATRA